MAAMPSPRRADLLRHPLGWIATGFGCGLVPKAPGTFGTLVALLPWWFLMRDLSPPVYLAVVLIAFALGVWASHWAIRRTGIQDPGFVVWDEFVGLWIALWLLPVGWGWIVAGFVLFRTFDIGKPWLVGWADRRLHGGFGAMFDDALAGIYALLVLQLMAVFLPA